MIGDIEEYVPKNTRIMSIKVAEIVNPADEMMARVEVKALGTTPDEMTAHLNREIRKWRVVFKEQAIKAE